MADVTILIDPVIIVPPDDDATREDVEKWLVVLEIWLREALIVPFTWLHDRQTSELLEANGQFPNFQQLRLLQQKHRLDIDINHIARYINDFFRDNTLDLDDHLEMLEFAIEPKAGSIVIEPEQFIARLPDYTHDDMHIRLAKCCACKQIEHVLGQGLHIVTLPLINGSKEIAVSIIILDALPEHIFPTNTQITHTFPLILIPNDLQPLINADTYTEV